MPQRLPRAASARAPRGFVFYDFETSGLDPAFDQILQVAALRTDSSFTLPNERGLSFDVRCRRLSHVVPSPIALLKTRVSIGDLQNAEYSFYEMMDLIAERFTQWGPAIFMGYNSIKFDERFLRQSLFASLQDPYLTNTNGSSRADVMIIAQTIAALSPGAIEIPMSDAGRATFALGAVCAVNGIPFERGAAHDAKADVRATLALTRHLQDNAPAVFASSLALADKEIALSLVRRNSFLFHLTSFRSAPVVRAVVPIGSKRDNANVVVCVDAAIDPDEYILLGDQEFGRWFSQRPGLVVTIRVNAHPQIFTPYVDMPGLAALRDLFDHEQSASGADYILSASDLQERAERIQTNYGFQERLFATIGRREEVRPGNRPVEQQIYDRFADRSDYAIGAHMHREFSLERFRYLSKIHDPRLADFADRWVFETAPETLAPMTRQRLDAWRRNRFLAPEGAPWRTIAKARAELLQIAEVAPVDDGLRLAEIDEFLSALEAAARAGS